MFRVKRHGQNGIGVAAAEQKLIGYTGNYSEFLRQREWADEGGAQAAAGAGTSP
jgi:ATPase subunit of ABC transporter with duplicated ATPase domains